jgi:hypothetical protein
MTRLTCDAGRPGRVRGHLVVPLVCVLTLGTACSGSGSDDAAPEAQAAPTRAGEVVPVDVCDLVGRQGMRRALGTPVRVVGRELEAPTLPTQTCLWGREFAVALLELQVTPGPVAQETFEAAFGPTAGDDPRKVSVGESAYAREGLTSRSLQVFANGVVLSLEASDAPGDRLPRDALTAVAARVLASLPRNPGLQDTSPPRPCAGIDQRAVAAAMRAPVRLRDGYVAGPPADTSGPAMCSWVGLPGEVVVTVRTDPVQITNFRANLSPRVYEPVPQVPAEAWSQSNRSGDLLVFLPDAVLEVSSLPGEGFSAQNTATTPGEVRLAEELVRVLG